MVGWLMTVQAVGVVFIVPMTVVGIRGVFEKRGVV